MESNPDELNENEDGHRAYRIEREFVKIIQGYVENSGFSHSEFAQKVWPEKAKESAITTWNAIRDKSSKTGRPQGLKTHEGLVMASIMGQDYVYIMVEAINNAKRDERDINKRARP